LKLSKFPVNINLLRALKTITKNKFEQLDSIETSMKQLDMNDVLISKYLEDFVKQGVVTKEIEFLIKLTEIKSSVLSEF
jgi:hypothetical protein